MNADEVREGIQAVRNQPMPTLGDPAKRYPVELTEPEINTIHSAMGFIRAVCEDWPDELADRYWKHYGPTLEGLSERLAVFYDEKPSNVEQSGPKVSPSHRRHKE